MYPYFVCARRHRVHDCTFKAVLIDEVEELVAALYQRIQLTTEDRAKVECYLQGELAQIEGEKDRTVRSLTTRRTNVEDKRRRLLHAHYEGAVPLDLLKEEQAQLTAELERIERQLDAYRADVTATRRVMEAVLDLMQDCSRLYSAAPAHLKKLLNQVFFERILVNPCVDDDGTIIMPGTSPSQSDSSNAADDVGQVSDRAERQHTDVASPCMSDELAVWSVPEDGGDGDMTTERAAMVCPRPLPRMTSGNNGITLTACLRFPFTYLASPALRRAAERDAIRLNKQKTGAQPHQQNTPIPANKHSPRHNLPHEAVPLGCCSYTRVLVQLRTIDPNNLTVLLDFRRKLAAGDGGQVCTGPNVAHLPATDGSDGAMGDADESRPSHGADAAEPEDEPLQRRPTAPATSVGEWPNDESDAPDTASRSPRVVDRIQTKFRPLTAEQRQQVVDLYRAGVPVKEIVRQTGVNRSTVYRLRGQVGLERNHRFTDEDRAQAILLRQQGMTIAEIAKRLGFSGMTIGRHLAAARKE